MVSVGRVCNMLAEIAKRRGDDEEASIRYYIRGITSEPLGYIDNYIDLGNLCEAMGYPELS